MEVMKLKRGGRQRKVTVGLNSILLVKPQQGSISLWILVEDFVESTAIKRYRAHDGGPIG